MDIDLFQVDAFTDRLFHGNPAAVCPLQEWLPERLMQAIATENNLSETAFVCQEGDDWAIRWFTPKIEVELCGHATLASAFVIFEELGAPGKTLRFRSRKQGMLTVHREDGRYALDFPSFPTHPRDPIAGLGDALGGAPEAVYEGESGRRIAIFAAAEEVMALAPDFRALRVLVDKIAVTAPGRGRDEDFVSRFFAPRAGIDEDPATGSAHCTLTPYWSRRLGKRELVARQLSPRGATLWCRDDGDRTRIAGHARLYLRGRIQLPDDS